MSSRSALKFSCYATMQVSCQHISMATSLSPITFVRAAGHACLHKDQLLCLLVLLDEVVAEAGVLVPLSTPIRLSSGMQRDQLGRCFGCQQDKASCLVCVALLNLSGCLG